ncbi:divergent polysaccharide deacetylase family protein, partial [Klebsiella pneumoniae]|uniref:divergent polysaccharide deacetylase family protein n=1 Tax=Klebsiella pneumoniae TaxID=573 RepID=UPI0021641A91
MLQFRAIALAVAGSLALAAPAFAGKLSIVIDDFGYRPQTENQVLALPATISVAVLPNAPHAREMATKAHNQGVVVKFFWTRRSDGRVMHRRATGRQGWPAFRT